MVEDPLVNPVIPPWMLEQMDFGPKYERTEQLLYWLTRWSGRNHALGGKVSTIGLEGSVAMEGGKGPGLDGGAGRTT